MATESFSTNASEVAARLDAMAAKVGDPTPGLERTRQVLAHQEAQVWATEGAELGVHWPPAADPARKVDSRLLVASGALRASLADAGAGRVAFDSLQFGTSVPYGRFHQYGSSRVPRRQFLGLSPETARLLTERYNEAIGEELR